MASPPSEDTKALFKLLADNEWHKYEDIKDQLARSIPPGRALRKYEVRLRSSRKVHDTANPTQPLSEDDQIFYGGRACAQVTISSWRERGLAQRQDEDGVKWIRIRPGFKAFGIEAKGIEEALAEGAPKGPATPVATIEVPPVDSAPPEVSPQPTQWPPVKLPDFVPPPAVPAEPVPVAVAEEPSRVADEPATKVIDQEPVRQWQRNSDGDWDPVEEPTEPVVMPAPDPIPQPSPSVTQTAVVECGVCGAVVIDSGFHNRWHEDQIGALRDIHEKIIDGVTLRTVVSGEIGQSLTSFQEGMTRYLDVVFSQLEAQIQVLSRPGVSAPWWAVSSPRKDSE